MKWQKPGEKMFHPKRHRKNAASVPDGETAAKLAALREELRRIERSDWNGKTGETIPLGLPEVDRLLSGEHLFGRKVLSSLEKKAAPPAGSMALPKSGMQPEPKTSTSAGPVGLRRGCLHEFSGEGAEAFAAILSGRLKGPILWCADMLDGSALYPPGLAAFGLDHRRLILVRCRKPREILAAMEDGLRCRALAAVIGELSDAVDLTASRRLQLAAENSGVTGFLVRSAWRDQVSKSQVSKSLPAAKTKPSENQDGNKAGAGQVPESQALLLRSEGKEPSAAFSRWSVDAARSSAGSGEYAADAMTWRLSLLRCRNGGGGTWMVKWDAKTYRFSLAAEVADGQIDPSSGQSPGQRLVG